MTNNLLLGAGDAPEKLIDSNGNTGSSSSPWTNLPLSAHNVLGSMLDTAGLCAMRLVCAEWKKNVEQGVGLKVKVDDSIEGNLEFVKRVKVEKARVLNWTVEIGTEPVNHLFQHSDWLRKLKLCGKMPAQWKIHDLRQFPNLAHLVLRGRALHSNNLTGHKYPVFDFDPTSELSADDMVIQAYQTQDPPSEAEPIEFKNLQTLEIIRYDHCTSFSCNQLKTHGYLLMMANLCFILSHVTSPLLSVAHVAVTRPEQLHGSLKKLNWKLAPLHRFLDNHRLSLRQLFLPNLEGQSTDLFKHEVLSNSFPINLRKLMLSLHGEWRDLYSREEPVQSTFAYLQRCLQGQTQLEDVCFYFSSFPLKWTSDAFTSLANSCGSTLRYLELQGSPDGGEGSLDLEMLSVCHSLEVLLMPWWGRTIMTFRNVDKLPTSLKILLICCSGEGGTIEIGDPRFFERLTVLEWVYLNRISLPNGSNPRNQERDRQYCRTMIKGLLGLRQLQGFSLGMQVMELNRDRILVKMLSSLDERINPACRYPQSTTRFNMSWRDYSSSNSGPWSDRTLFDISEWDMEKYKDDADEPKPIERRQQEGSQQEVAQNGLVENAEGINEDVENDQDDVNMDMDYDSESSSEYVSSDEE